MEHVWEKNVAFELWQTIRSRIIYESLLTENIYRKSFQTVLTASF